ncbi:DUF262 domain-containing protein, partial [Campylobacter volucris]|uniref:hypothetical protein n=1 Tax=Campylobacter volucris TaxID=1031542 RepID=UPI001E5CBFF1
GNIDDFLSEIMLFLNNTMDIYLISELKLMFKNTMNFTYDNYGQDIFRFNNLNGINKRPINMALFESLSYLFTLCMQQGKKPSKEAIDNLKLEFDKSGKFVSGIDS